MRSFPGLLAIVAASLAFLPVLNVGGGANELILLKPYECGSTMGSGEDTVPPGILVLAAAVAGIGAAHGEAAAEGTAGASAAAAAALL